MCATTKVLPKELAKKIKENTRFLSKSGVLWLRRQDSNLRPPGYELAMRVQSVGEQGFHGTFRAKKRRKPGGRSTKLNRLFDRCPPLWVSFWVKRGSRVWAVPAAEKSKTVPLKQRIAEVKSTPLKQ